MLYCCAGSTGCCHRHFNGISFENLKTKYALNEDIIVDYVIRDNIQTSTRDWIGIFPRGWTNLQQYLTFEYALVAPMATSLPNRTVIFINTFHQEAFLNTEYQLVYVSKQIQIVATSTYFRFTEPVCDSEVTKRSRPICRPEVRLAGYSPYAVMSDQSLIKSKGSSMTLNEGSASTYSAGSLPLVTSMMKNVGVDASGEARRICRHCNRPMTNSRIAAGRARFLASHNDSLIGRVGRLERDLGLAEESVKHARLVRENLVNRLQGYEAFVAEMLKSLAVKGTVKITDTSGKEVGLFVLFASILSFITLTRVNPENVIKEVEAVSLNKVQKREHVLMTVIKRQERIINQLVQGRNRYRQAYKNDPQTLGDQEFQAVNVIPKELFKNNLFSTKEQFNQNSDLPSTMNKDIQCVKTADEDEESHIPPYTKTQINVTDTRGSSMHELIEICKCSVEYEKPKMQNSFDIQVPVPTEYQEPSVDPTKHLDFDSLTVKSVEKFDEHDKDKDDECSKRMKIKSEVVQTDDSNEIEGQTLILKNLEADETSRNKFQKVPTIQNTDNLLLEETKKEESSRILKKQENLVKPSAIVIQGNNMKFAIIRY